MSATDVVVFGISSCKAP